MIVDVISRIFFFQPPRIGGIKVYVENLKRDEILLDLELLYSSDAEIKVAVRGFTAGIKTLTVSQYLHWKKIRHAPKLSSPWVMI